MIHLLHPSSACTDINACTFSFIYSLIKWSGWKNKNTSQVIVFKIFGRKLVWGTYFDYCCGDQKPNYDVYYLKLLSIFAAVSAGQ